MHRRNVVGVIGLVHHLINCDAHRIAISDTHVAADDCTIKRSQPATIGVADRNSDFSADGNSVVCAIDATDCNSDSRAVAVSVLCAIGDAYLHTLVRAIVHPDTTSNIGPIAAADSSPD